MFKFRSTYFSLKNPALQDSYRFLVRIANLFRNYLFHMIGAGDIKLLCALGGIMGPRTVMECIVYSLLAGAGISLAILISTGGIRRRFLYLYQYMNEFYCTGEIRPYYRKGMSFPENFHFTVPIFLSAVLYAGGVY